MIELLTPYFTYIAGAAIVLAALIVALLVYRALRGAVKGRRGQRLGVSEYHELDQSRRLVLIRRDGVEHLLLIGGAQDLVIETDIDADARPSLTYEREEPALGPAPLETVRPMPIRPAPRPAVFGDRAPLRAVERDGKARDQDA